MTDEQKTKAAELKAVIASTVGTREGVPAEIRSEAVALRSEVRRAGGTSRALATALGVHETSLCRWEREANARRKSAARPARGPSRAPGFRLVKVAASKPAPTAATTGATAPAPRGLRALHAPSGLVVDGLDVETLAALLRRMT